MRTSLSSFFLAAAVLFPVPPAFSQAAWPPALEFPSEITLPAHLPVSAGPSPVLDARELTSFARGRIWLNIAANSEQRQPVYLGRRPRDIELGRGGQPAGLPVALKAAGEKQAAAIRAALAKKKLIGPRDAVELEAWPVRDDDGRLTWAFARWRPLSAQAPMSWLNVEPPDSLRPAPFVPEYIDPSSKNGYHRLFADVLEFDSLYDKPLFGDALWLDRTGAVTAAWLPPDDRDSFSASAAGRGLTAAVLPQPARLDGAPVSYRLSVRGNSVQWPADASWMTPPSAGPPAQDSGAKVPGWPAGFLEAYKKDVMLLAGETEAVFPLSGRRERFIKKNNIETDNQLNAVVAYLEERYSLLGIRTERQTFPWRGAAQTNLIAVIPGADHSRPILIADHMDTAFCEDSFSGGDRVSSPGADDNMSAAAALLRAAELFKGKKLERDIWLVHLTGEEFPADDLGARHFISGLLAQKKDIGGLVLLDMIGWRSPGDKIFQISAGESAESLGLANVALAAAKDFPELSPVLRTRFDRRSYLYNTDGLIFSDAGFPVILFNEHINALENLSRSGYHDTTDTSARIDFGYASGIAKIAITTAARLAGMK